MIREIKVVWSNNMLSAQMTDIPTNLTVWQRLMSLHAGLGLILFRTLTLDEAS